MQLDFVEIVLRWMHILAAIAAAGGTIFMRVALVPASGELAEPDRQRLLAAVRSRWAMVVHLSIALLLISGLINVMRIMPTIDSDYNSLYHPLFGVKFLLALALFGIASLLIGRSPAADRVRANAPFWLGINTLLVVLIVLISGVLRFVPRDVAPPEEPVAAALHSSSAERSGALSFEPLPVASAGALYQPGG